LQNHEKKKSQKLKEKRNERALTAEVGLGSKLHPQYTQKDPKKKTVVARMAGGVLLKSAKEWNQKEKTRHLGVPKGKDHRL